MSADDHISDGNAVVSGAVKRFIAHRLQEVVGLLGLAAGLTLLVILATASPTDPNWNTASDAPIMNWLGPAGAHIAEAYFVMVGLTAFLMPLSLVAWGVRFLIHHGLPLWQWRIPLLFVSLGFLSVVLHEIGQWLDYPAISGFFGQFLMDKTSLLFGSVTLPEMIPVSVLVALIYAVIGVPLYSWASAFSAYEARLVKGLLGLLFWPLKAVWAGVRRLTKRQPKPLQDTEAGAEPKTKSKKKKAAKTTVRAEPVLVPNATPLAPEAPPVESRKPAKKEQASFDFESQSGFQLPSSQLLKQPTKAAAGPGDAVLSQNAEALQEVLGDFGVSGDIQDVAYGPVVTRYGLIPAPGTKSQRVIALADDIARSMSALSVRVAVVPGQNVIGIELPNDNRETVLMRDILDHPEWQQNTDALPICLGKDIAGAPVVTDLAKMPHLLVAGTTGSGKSVGINAMILSLLYRHTPETCRLIMIDPKMLELSVYDGIPHLLSPVVTDPSKAVTSLKWAVREMENRYHNMSKLGVRNITGYNQRLAEARASGEVLTRRVQTGFDAETGKPIFEEQALDLAPLPYIVVIIDEVADLMLVAGKDIEAAVQRLAQMARAAGIHVIMATQRPSVDVITGTIKANFPTRISFQVTSKIDSRTILGEQGAEQLLGRGDMLFMEGGGRIKRVHGPFMEDREVEKVADFLRAQGEPEYDDRVTEDQEEGDAGAAAQAQPTGESLYDQAVALVIREQKASTSFVQRHLKIGYNRAATIIEEMEAAGIISKANHVGKREVLLEKDEM